MIQEALFQLGRVSITRRVAEELEFDFTANLLKRHVTGDWPNLTEEEKEINRNYFPMGDECFISQYETMYGKVIIATFTSFTMDEDKDFSQHDQSDNYTNILFADEERED